ncbi:apolipoprotein A-V [Zootoca vivipara]|uniref:apolipoprotein A-V n=1 Tax=Zootoca vivipara TaxID=8524 RepID=UPI001590C914|nr:apolipoprotein A-V [Zootoca vivipara]XP_034996045.1 apolipoprotein A-V [Zootoca vivipara]XP_034996046.1 apolipoprotein A-V [Zootoca vivipara]XP_034996048.1 apolipoprotein A-V [Zootoca vivipara]
MCIKAALLAVLLATFSASPASLQQSHVWDYFSQLTRDKGSTEQAQQLKGGQGVKNVKESLQDGANYVGNVLEKLTPGQRRFRPQFYQDADGLRQIIQREVESLRRKLSPYMDEAHQKISQNIEVLRLRLTPLTEQLMEQVSLCARELHQHFRPNLNAEAPLVETPGAFQKFTASFAEKAATFIDQVKEIFHPYADRLATEIHRTMEELHKNTTPHTAVMGQRLSQYLQEFSGKLTHNARVLHLQIERNLEQLKVQLSLHPSTWVAHPSHRSQENHQLSVDSYLENMAQEVQERIEEFRRGTILQIDNFTRTTDREMEEMKSKLSPTPSYLEEFQENSTPLEDLHAKLDSLWKDIFQSLNEPSTSLY